MKKTRRLLLMVFTVGALAGVVCSTTYAARGSVVSWADEDVTTEFDPFELTTYMIQIGVQPDYRPPIRVPYRPPLRSPFRPPLF